MNQIDNKLTLGNIILFKAIEQIISNQGKSMHLLWGESDYKVRFGGVKKELHFYKVYKKTLLMWLYAKIIQIWINIKIEAINNIRIIYNLIKVSK